MAINNISSVLNAIDTINSQDPNTINYHNEKRPKELVYGQQMSACLAQYWPQADELLQIAVRAQHIKRWHLKRDDFAEGKVGYLKWRKALGVYHAQLTESLMAEHGYPVSDCHTVGAIIRKEQLKTNRATQTLEDVACLVFLQHYFADFAAKHSEEKIIHILQKTWGKMSEPAKNIALTLPLEKPLAELVARALA